MERQPVKSSQIKSVGYDPASKTLEMEFVHCGGVYQYSNVEAHHHADLLKAESIGSHFHKFIKPYESKFPFKKVSTAKPK